jgi:glycosyltransferase involved in cell wall biosynthesis
VGIHREIAQAGAGRVVPCEVAPLEQALGQAVADPQWRAQAGENARNLAKRFVPEIVADELSALYQRTRISSQQKDPMRSDGTNTPRVSVVILTLNEETNLPDCLESLNGLNCRVFVVDSYSTDRTPAIAKARGIEFVQHEFKNYSVQRNWAQHNLPIETPWVLHLDADERLTPELAAEIDDAVRNAPADLAGFLLRKRTIFMGKWIRHGGHYPSYHLRLFRACAGRCEDRLYDQHFLVDGRVGRLKRDYLDVIASSLSAWSARHVRWAEMEARETVAATQGRQVVPDLRGNPIERRRWWRNTYVRCPLFVRAFAYWLYRYFFRLGFLDGKEGLIFHFLQGFWFRFLVDSIVLEQRGSEPRSDRETDNKAQEPIGASTRSQI